MQYIQIPTFYVPDHDDDETITALPLDTPERITAYYDTLTPAQRYDLLNDMLTQQEGQQSDD